MYSMLRAEILRCEKKRKRNKRFYYFFFYVTLAVVSRVGFDTTLILQLLDNPYKITFITLERNTCIQLYSCTILHSKVVR